jgi:hypothetical protein
VVTLSRGSIAVSILIALFIGTLHAGAFASSDAARELVDLLDGRGLDAIATSDPMEPGTFVAALYVPGSQLLVVRARHPSVEGVIHRISMSQYREVYLDLHGSPTPQGKFFVHDSGADGILSAAPGNGDVDVLYEDGVRQTLFNGDARTQHMTSTEYEKKLAYADTYYAQLLNLLASAVRKDGEHLDSDVRDQNPQ